jgi:hypothetical protein
VNRNSTHDRKPSGADRPQTRKLTEAELDAVSGGTTTGGAGAGNIKYNEFTIKKTSDMAAP